MAVLLVLLCSIDEVIFVRWDVVFQCDLWPSVTANYELVSLENDVGFTRWTRRCFPMWGWFLPPMGNIGDWWVCDGHSHMKWWLCDLWIFMMFEPAESGNIYTYPLNWSWNLGPWSPWAQKKHRAPAASMDLQCCWVMLSANPTSKYCNPRRFHQHRDLQRAISSRLKRRRGMAGVWMVTFGEPETSILCAPFFLGWWWLLNDYDGYLLNANILFFSNFCWCMFFHDFNTWFYWYILAFLFCTFLSSCRMYYICYLHPLLECVPSHQAIGLIAGEAIVFASDDPLEGSGRLSEWSQNVFFFFFFFLINYIYIYMVLYGGFLK